MTDARRSPNAPMCQRLKNQSFYMRLFTSGSLCLIIMHKNTYVAGFIESGIDDFHKEHFRPRKETRFQFAFVVLISSGLDSSDLDSGAKKRPAKKERETIQEGFGEAMQ